MGQEIGILVHMSGDPFVCQRSVEGLGIGGAVRVDVDHAAGIIVDGRNQEEGRSERARQLVGNVFGLVIARDRIREIPGGLGFQMVQDRFRLRVGERVAVDLIRHARIVPDNVAHGRQIAVDPVRDGVTQRFHGTVIGSGG